LEQPNHVRRSRHGITRRAAGAPTYNGPEVPWTTHEPGQIAQPSTVALDQLRDCAQLGRAQIVAGAVALHQGRPTEQGAPALQHLITAPFGGLVGIEAQHEVAVVGHRAVGADIDGEQPLQQREALDQPLAPVLEGLPSDRIHPAQESPPHAAADAVVEAR